MKFRHEWEEVVKEAYDYTGAVVYFISIIIMMLGLTQIPSIYGYILFSASLIILIVFYFIESKKTFPLFNVVVFRKNRTFALSNLAALINYSATFALGFLLSFYLQIVKGLTPQETGIILITQPVVQAVFSPFTGRLSDKYEPRYVSSAGMTFLTIGLAVFIFLTPSTSIALITSNLVFLGFGFALFSSPNVNAIMSSVEKKFYGVASSTMSSMRMIGQMLSMGMVIIIFNVYLGSAAISKTNSGSFMTSARTAFIIFSIFSALGIYFSFSRGKIH
jgi:MFS family permease